jgi:hypothetical protein
MPETVSAPRTTARRGEVGDLTVQNGWAGEAMVRYYGRTAAGARSCWTGARCSTTRPWISVASW